MRRLLPTVAVVATLLLPLSASADTLSFVVSGGELPVDFGLVPFTMSETLRSDSFDAIGSASLVSGPLLGLDVDAANGLTTYQYGPGLLELTFTEDGNGNPVAGTFSAPTQAFSFVVCEGCDTLFGGGTANDFQILLGEGTFSAAIASLLGISPHTTGGFIDFGLEDIDGGPDSQSRRGFDHRGAAFLEIEAVEAPEPGTLMLGLVAAAGLAARRRRAT